MNRLAQAARERMAEQEYALASRWAGIENGTVTTETTHPAIARMNEVMASGRYDKDAATGANLLGKRVIAGERFYYQIAQDGRDVVFAFFSADRFGHTRRMLVTGAGIYWLEIEGNRAIGTHNKYAIEAAALLAERAKAASGASGAWREAA